jgi:hypothetical protein
MNGETMCDSCGENEGTVELCEGLVYCDECFREAENDFENDYFQVTDE